MIFISQITPPIIKCFMPFCTIFYFYKSSKFEKIDILNKWVIFMVYIISNTKYNFIIIVKNIKH